MNYDRFHNDWQSGMDCLMSTGEWLIEWAVFLVCLPVTWPLSKLGKSRRQRSETYYRDTYGR